MNNQKEQSKSLFKREKKLVVKCIQDRIKELESAITANMAYVVTAKIMYQQTFYDRANKLRKERDGLRDILDKIVTML